MEIEITARHVDLTEAMRDHARGLAERIGAEFPRVEHVHMIMDIQKYRHIAEAVVQAKNHVRARAAAESDDMYASLDTATEKIMRHLRRERDKVQEHRVKERAE